MTEGFLAPNISRVYAALILSTQVYFASFLPAVELQSSYKSVTPVRSSSKSVTERIFCKSNLAEITITFYNRNVPRSL